MIGVLGERSAAERPYRVPSPEMKHLLDAIERIEADHACQGFAADGRSMRGCDVCHALLTLLEQYGR